jgi:hypothetical protein
MENQRNATSLIHTVSAACKNIPYTQETKDPHIAKQ